MNNENDYLNFDNLNFDDILKIFANDDSCDNCDKCHKDKNEHIDKNKTDEIKKEATKCFHCRKKINLAGRYKCRCENTYCMSHRYPFSHDCKYDDKTEYIDNLKKSNMKIVADKVDKI